MSFSYSSFTFSLILENDPQPREINFQEISGLIQAVHVKETKKVKKAALLKFVPINENDVNLILKRGIIDRNSKIYKWCNQALKGSLEIPLREKNLLIHFTDENAEVIKTWRLLDAWPVKMAVSEFKSSSDKLAVEVLEFRCSGIEESNSED